MKKKYADTMTHHYVNHFTGESPLAEWSLTFHTISKFSTRASSRNKSEIFLFSLISFHQDFLELDTYCQPHTTPEFSKLCTFIYLFIYYIKRTRSTAK